MGTRWGGAPFAYQCTLCVPEAAAFSPNAHQPPCIAASNLKRRILRSLGRNQGGPEEGLGWRHQQAQHVRGLDYYLIMTPLPVNIITQQEDYCCWQCSIAENNIGGQAAKELFKVPPPSKVEVFKCFFPRPANVLRGATTARCYHWRGALRVQAVSNGGQSSQPSCCGPTPPGAQGPPRGAYCLLSRL